MVTVSWWYLVEQWHRSVHPCCRMLFHTFHHIHSVYVVVLTLCSALYQIQQSIPSAFRKISNPINSPSVLSLSSRRRTRGICWEYKWIKSSDWLCSNSPDEVSRGQNGVVSLSLSLSHQHSMVIIIRTYISFAARMSSIAFVLIYQECMHKQYSLFSSGHHSLMSTCS